MSENLVNNVHSSDFDILNRKLVLFKSLLDEKVEMLDSGVNSQSDELSREPFINEEVGSHSKILMKADVWDKTYSEFDIVSSLYPFIPTKLFNAIGQKEGSPINDRVKIVDTYSYGLTAFFDQDPLLVSKTLGLHQVSSDSSTKSKIYRFDQKRANFYLMEINDQFESGNSKEHFVITVFISPRKLTQFEKQKIEKIKNKDPLYYQGATKGWSILVTGQKKYNTIILPGKKSRSELSDALPKEFWEEYKNFKFKFLDGKLMEKNAS